MRVVANNGLEGWGEHVSAPQYMVALQGGALAALDLLVPSIIDVDIRHNHVVHAAMNRVLKGHAYAKTALDIALWDLTSKSSGVSLAVSLGGIFQTEFGLMKMIVSDDPLSMKKACQEASIDGHRILQIKIGQNWHEDIDRIESCMELSAKFDRIIFDANGGYSVSDALMVLNATRHLNFVIEQPCLTLEDNISLRKRVDKAFVLDESLDSIDSLLTAYRANAFDMAMLKFSRFGGVGPTAFARDLCQQWGVPVTMEDISGGGVVTAAAAHLAASTPKHILNAGSFTTQYVEETYIKGSWPNNTYGSLPPDTTGLGVQVDKNQLPPPIFQYYC